MIPRWRALALSWRGFESEMALAGWQAKVGLFTYDAKIKARARRFLTDNDLGATLQETRPGSVSGSESGSGPRTAGRDRPTEGEEEAQGLEFERGRTPSLMAGLS